MKQIFALAVVILLGTGLRGGVAQEMLVAPPGNTTETLPQFELPEVAGDAGSSYSSSGISQESIDTISDPNALDGPQPYVPSENLHVLDSDPALLESTGTWLRRGFWFAEVDALILDRSFGDKNFVLIGQVTAVDEVPVSTPITGVDIFRNVRRNNNLGIRERRGKSEGVPRLKLGRFLFRDSANRDHMAEVTFYGGGQWSQSGSLTEVPVTLNPLLPDITDDLQVPGNVDNGNPSFDGASASQYEYDSRFNSFEVNYHIKQRMRRDRMELSPNGTWVRRAHSGFAGSIIAGLRYFDVTENLKWDAFGIDDADADGTDETGNYRVRIDNDLIGAQIGGTITRETARWSIGMEVKGGMFLNVMDLDSEFNITGGLGQGSTRLQEDAMSFIGEAAVRGRWHLRPNLSIRTGIEVLYISSTALAPFQVNFTPGSQDTIVSSPGNAFFGTSFGFEGYW